VTCENPTVPTLSGTQIDRVGRPAVNSALTNPFGLYMVNGMAQTTDTTKAAYNADSLPTDWLTNWPTAIKLSLGVFDAIDGVCANQIAYGALTEPNYTLLSQVLAGDALQVDTTQGTCKTYLGVEQAFLGGNIMDCGGRTLTENTIDVTYGALAGPAQPVVNGITTPAVAPLSSFPFLAAPM